MAFKRGLVTLAVLATFGMANSALAAGPPDGLQVNVINTPANAVPVTGSITGSVTGTVGLAPGTKVLIDSTVGNPVRVRNVNDAIQPVQAKASCTSPAGTIGCGPANIYTVPAGKRLVIEYASMAACMLPGQTVQSSVATNLGGAYVTHFLNTPQPTAGPGSSAIGCNVAPSSLTAVGQQLRLYADAGTAVLAGADRTSNLGSSSFEFTISGYLVDVPLTP